MKEQSLQAHFDDIHWESGVAGILDKVIEYCMNKRTIMVFRGCVSFAKDYTEQIELIRSIIVNVENRD